jgi:SAM-dependent methyltransferase
LDEALVRRVSSTDNRATRRARLEAEFGHYTTWLADAIQTLGFRDPVPPACRGTGNPFLLEHLAAALALTDQPLVLDVGVGLGGPGAWLIRERSCRLVGIDVMIQGALGVRRLFQDMQVAVASSEELPFGDRTFDAAWALGVVEMLPDKERAFREIARVLVPGARLVLYDFVATASELRGSPAADRFESAEGITKRLQESGFHVLRSEAVPSMSPPPDEWRAATASVRQLVHDEHCDDRRLRAAENERDSFNRLRRSGSIREWEFVAEKSSE